MTYFLLFCCSEEGAVRLRGRFVSYENGKKSLIGIQTWSVLKWALKTWTSVAQIGTYTCKLQTINVHRGTIVSKIEIEAILFAKWSLYSRSSFKVRAKFVALRLERFQAKGYAIPQPEYRDVLFMPK